MQRATRRQALTGSLHNKSQKQLAAENIKLREQTAEAAKAVKDAAAASPPLFTLNLDSCECHEFADGQELNVSLPIVFRQPPCLESFAKDAKAQLMFGNFGGQYKKAKGIEDDGFYQQPAYKATE